LISGSLWSSATGAPFTYPFTVGAPNSEATISPRPIPAPSPPTAPGPLQEEPHTAKSGTGFFVTNDGRVITNAHVVRDCSEIHVGTGQGNFVDARLVARDTTNDLALLKVEFNSPYVASLRFAVRLGENVEAFGYPLSQVLATTGNFTTGNVTALAGIGDDSRYIQISAPIQPGNSGGPLLDENGNLVGIVTSKLNVIAALKNAGDIPQNVNFAIKASTAANFLQDNSVKFQIGEATQAMKSADLADQAKALSVYIECR
jgi:serine protease Do